MKQAAVSILTPEGDEIARASIDLPHGFLEPTGLYRLKGDQSVQVVAFGRVGAKAALARVYDFKGNKLREIFEWSGWSFDILVLDGNTVLAAKDYQQGLTDLYAWREGPFQRSNGLFPEYYGPEIERQERFIRSARGPFAGSFGQACRLAAQALLYRRRYAEATEQCSEALNAIESRCCSAGTVSKGLTRSAGLRVNTGGIDGIRGGG